jgi:hypothetical protein
MNIQPINDHQFDGKLKGIFQPHYKWVNEDKIKMFNKLIQTLTDSYAIDTVRTIIIDLPHTNGSNYQAENDANASDILASILSNDNWLPLLPILEEQLSDVKKSGICNSGRVTRLLQVWLCLPK